MIERKFKHLYAVRKWQGKNGLGTCFQQSLALVLDSQGSELCVGVFSPADEEERKVYDNASTVAFLHAWTERNGEVIAPTAFDANGGFCSFDREQYYEANGARDIRRMNRKEVLALSGEIGMSAYFRNGTPLKGDIKLVPEVLKRMGIAWREDQQSGIVPA